MDIKILFVFYPLYVNYNHGIALLSSLCKNYGIETSLYLLDNVVKFSEYLSNNDFDYIGFSCVTRHDYKLALPFMLAARQHRAMKLLGGVYPRLAFAGTPPVDKVCYGEAENLPQFLINGNNSLFVTPNYCANLNDLPLPDYELFKDIPYDRQLPLGTWSKALPYSSSRGCPFRCNFCQVAYQPKGVRIRTKVGDDLKAITELHQPDIIHFIDELIPYYDEGWRESWGDMVYPFIAYIRGDIPEKQLIWLKDHGLQGCFFGVESGNEFYRNEFLGKNLSNKQISNTVGLLNEMDIPFMASYMRGMPGETWEMQAETVKLSREIAGFPVFYTYENLIGG